MITIIRLIDPFCNKERRVKRKKITCRVFQRFDRVSNVFARNFIEF